MTTLSAAAVRILSTPEPAEKVRLTREAARDWHEGRIAGAGDTLPPARPARPALPELLPPNRMPRRSYGGAAGRIALIHALAHIELNAIDLAWDIVCRFPAEAMPAAFLDDWVEVAQDEARHFELLDDLLGHLGSGYGALPAHDGLWQAAEKTADDLMARLAVVPLTLEARGVDTTPATIARLERSGDTLTPPVLAVIYDDEIAHVAKGVRWFAWLAKRRGQEPAHAYAAWMAERYPAGLKEPFNHDGRAAAGFPRDWYLPLAR